MGAAKSRPTAARIAEPTVPAPPVQATSCERDFHREIGRSGVVPGKREILGSALPLATVASSLLRADGASMWSEIFSQEDRKIGRASRDENFGFALPPATSTRRHVLRCLVARRRRGEPQNLPTFRSSCENPALVLVLVLVLVARRRRGEPQISDLARLPISRSLCEKSRRATAAQARASGCGAGWVATNGE